MDAPSRDGKPTVRRFRRPRSWLWLAIVVPIVWGVYVYFMSAGGMPEWPVYGWFHDNQADAFREGHLHLSIPVAPELLNAEDPYDTKYRRYSVLDASYYKGKYYIYWGPVPALLQAAAKSILGIRRSIGDHYLTLFFLCLAAWAGALIIVRMARRLFGLVNKPLVTLGILAFCFASPILHAATTGGTYNTAIIAAQAWLLVGFVPALDAVWYGGADRARRLRLVAAGMGWALALASRVALLPAIAVFFVLTSVAVGWSARPRWRSLLSSSLWLGMPLAIIGCALLAYNKVRFDDWFEFGSKIQLSGYPTVRFRTAYLWPNLYSYAWRPWVSSCEFPYLFQVWWMGQDAFPQPIALPPDYMIDEPVIGWLRAVPLSWCIPFAFLYVPRASDSDTSVRRTYLWCLFSFAAMASVTGLAALALYVATMRYLGDTIYGLVLLSLLGAFALRSSRLMKRARRTTGLVLSVLALSTVVIGMLIGYQGYNGHFANYNPQLHAKFVKALSLCGSERPKLPRFAPR